MATALATTHRLTPQEEQFVYNLAVLGMSQEKSARMANYKDGSSGTYLMRKPWIVEAVEMQRAKNRKALEYTRDEVLRGIKEAVEQAVLLADPTAQIAGWREIGKMLGYYDEAQKPKDMTPLQRRLIQKFENMEPEQLLALIANPVEGKIIDGQD